MCDLVRNRKEKDTCQTQEAYLFLQQKQRKEGRQGEGGQICHMCDKRENTLNYTWIARRDGLLQGIWMVIIEL